MHNTPQRETPLQILLPRLELELDGDFNHKISKYIHEFSHSVGKIFSTIFNQME